MRILDLYCGAGGAGAGYAQAGYDVTGVDIDPQPDYPFEFWQTDALEFLSDLVRFPRARAEYDLIHASPPCQTHSALTAGNRGRGWEDDHVDLIPETRELLDATGIPYVIENVQGAPIRRDLTLCGEMFGLAVIRHRYFELGRWTTEPPTHIRHRGRVAGWRHGIRYDGPYFAVHGDGGGKGSITDWQHAMGIDWMTTKHDLSEAIPPAYTKWIGERYALLRSDLHTETTPIRGDTNADLRTR